MIKLIEMVASVTLLSLSSVTAYAGLIFTLDEVGSDIVVSGSGSFDLTGTSLIGSSFFTDGFVNSSVAVAVGSGAFDAFSGFTSNPGAIGTGAIVVGALSSGDVFGIDWVQQGGLVFLPTGYVSGAALSGSTILSNQSFASLGLTSGTFNYTTANDTITIQVATAVPEPTSLALLGFGLLGMGLARRAQNKA